MLTVNMATRSIDARSQADALGLEVELRGMGTYRVLEHIVLTHEDPKATNAADEVNNVVPRVQQGATVRDSRVRALCPRCRGTRFA
ncbi:MAG: alpha-L-arabinofuranosidase C-terminal domain-containing protein [Bacteroidota bacterium]